MPFPCCLSYTCFSCAYRIPGRAAEELKALYEKGLSEHPGWFVKRDYREETEPVNKITILTNPIQVGIKEPVLFYEMTDLMAQAGEPVTFHTPYIMCNDYMMERLKEVCDSTETTMMTNSVANNGNPFGAVDYQVHRQALLDTGLHGKLRAGCFFRKCGRQRGRKGRRAPADALRQTEMAGLVYQTL